MPYPGAKDGGRTLWIGLDYNFTDEEGYFIEADGSKSRVIHQYDRFGPPFISRWLAHKRFVTDRIVQKALTLSLSPLPRKMTSTKIDVSMPSLVEPADRNGTDAIFALVRANEVESYKNKLTAHRANGYKGQVYLLLEPYISTADSEFFKSLDATVKTLNWVSCSGSRNERQKCAEPMTDAAVSLSRIFLFEEFLIDCQSCNGRVGIVDDPERLSHDFVFGAGPLKGLQVLSSTDGMVCCVPAFCSCPPVLLTSL